jgi:hypothetical protein
MQNLQSSTEGDIIKLDPILQTQVKPQGGSRTIAAIHRLEVMKI